VPTYTDPASGRRIRSDAPLTDAELVEAFGGTPAPADRMPLVTEPLAGEGPRPRPFGLPPAADVLPNPLDVPGKVARGLGLGPAVDYLNDPANAIALTFPTGSSLLGAMGLGGAAATVSHAAKLARERGVAALEPETLTTLGLDFLVGGATAGAARGVTNVLFGRAHPERRAAEAVLGDPPPPVVGEASEEGRGPFLERVNAAFRTAVRPVDDDAVTAAYEQFRAQAARPIDVTAYNRVLRKYDTQVAPGLRQSVPERLFAPVGGPAPRDPFAGVAGAPPSREVASVDQIIASDKGINLAVRLKNPDGSSTLPGGMMQQLKRELKQALDASLAPAEREAYRGAQRLALEQARMDDAVALLTGTHENGLPRPDKVYHLLDADKTGKYLDQFGPELHGQLLRIADAGKTLMRHPLGRRVFAQVIARLPGTVAGAAVGSLSGDVRGTLGGAVAGAALSPAPSLLAPRVLERLELLARHRAGSDPFIQAAGRLAVALAMEDTPAPDPRSDPTTAPTPLPLPTPTPAPLGRVGAP
jgi:hypothetical protein